MCSGCIVEPTETRFDELLKYCHLAIEWNSKVIEDQYNPTANDILRHKSSE